MAKYLFSILTIIFLISCNATDDSENEMQENEEMKNNEDKESETKIYLVGTTSNINSMTAENVFDFTDYNNTFSIDQNGKLVSWEIRFTNGATSIEFQSESGRITNFKIEDFDHQSQSTSLGEFTLEYDSSNRIIKFEQSSNGELFREYDIIYNGNEIDFMDLIEGRHRKVELNSDSKISVFRQENINATILFEYANGNLVKKTSIRENDTTVLNYVHDENNNPLNSEVFLNFSTINDYLGIIAGWEFLYYDENSVLGNANNIVEFEVINDRFDELQNRNFDYEYDENGNPTTKTNENGTITVDYNYKVEQ